MIVWSLLQSGLGNLAAYLAAHVLLCLVPGFLIAGGLTALVPAEAVTRYLGPRAPRYVAYPAASVGGFVLAVCSCTILPLFAGIYKKGAGLGPAITFLFVGPAINILALSYTGVALGMDIAVARLVLSILFGVGIGLIMAGLFGRGEQRRPESADGRFDGTARIEPSVWLFMGLLLALLVAGTLRIEPLTAGYASLNLPFPGAQALQAALNQLVPFDPTRGEEGVTVQGTLLIILLMLISMTAWRGLGRIDEGPNRWSPVALALVAATLLVAAAQLVPVPGGLQVVFTGKFVIVLLLLAALWRTAQRLPADEMQSFLWETWRFVRQIMPLLILGVFVVGVLRPLVRPEWIESLAGRNTLLANLASVLFGVIMYFPTLVEVPIANLFLSLGMHRGPLLAYLMADPELSLQSVLITARVIGGTRAWVYVGWVALFSTVAGLLYGAWVDGIPAGWLALAVLAGLGLLVALIALVSRRQAFAGTMARAK